MQSQHSTRKFNHFVRLPINSSNRIATTHHFSDPKLRPVVGSLHFLQSSAGTSDEEIQPQKKIKLEPEEQIHATKELTTSFVPTPTYMRGEKIRCKWMNNEYAAQIKDKWEERGKTFYHIHYLGWSSSWDEEISDTSRLRKWDAEELPPGYFNVQQVVAKRARRRKKSSAIVEYLVRWEGYGPVDDTWEPEQKLVADGCGWAIEAFERKGLKQVKKE